MSEMKPELRFKRFSDGWHVRQFDSIVSRTGSFSDDKHLARVEYEDIISGTGELNKDLFSKKTLKKGLSFSKGDILFGKLRPYLKNWLLATFDGIAVGDFWVLRPKDGVDARFAYMLLQTAGFMEIANQSAGSKMPRSDWGLVSNSCYHIPAEGAEQHCVGELFKSLEQAISLGRRKYEKLQALKKVYLDKLFPKNGSTVPEMRFKGFEGEWHAETIGATCSIITGGTPNTMTPGYWAPKQIPWLSSGEVHKKYITHTDDSISDEGLKNSNAQWVPAGSVLIALAGQGKTRGTVAITQIQLTTNQSIAALVPDSKKMSSVFLFANLAGRYEELRRMSSADGSRGGLNKQILASITIKLPGIKEQEKIGRFFCKLDMMIASYQRSLEKLRSLKSAFLEKMFV